MSVSSRQQVSIADVPSGWWEQACDYFRLVERAPAIPALEGLRALAIVLVLGRHSVHVFTTDDEELWMVGSWNAASPLLNGWMGVDLFFVLSGFLIFHHLAKAPFQTELGLWLRRFFKKRALRIMPIYWAVVLLVIMGLFPGYVPEYISTDQSLANALAVHAVFMSDLLGSGFVVGVWSLGVEEKFYLLAPFLFLLVLKIKVLRWKIVLLLSFSLLSLVLRLLVLSESWHNEMHYGEFFWAMRAPFYMAMEGLMFGAAIATLFNNTEVREKIRCSVLPRAASMIGWSIIVVSLFAYPIMGVGHWYVTAIHLTLLAAAFALIVFAAVFGAANRSKWLQAPTAMKFSKLSYCLYLIHQPLIPLTLMVLEMLIPFSALTTYWQLIFFIPGFLFISIGASLLMHFMVEKPFLLLKNKI